MRSKGKRVKKKEYAKKNSKKTNKSKKIILIILQTIFITIMIVSAIKIYFWWQENKQNKNILDKISEKVTIDNTQGNDNNKYKVDFNSLKQTNNDTIAWLKVNGTQIEYPIVKYSNNDYYLNHSFDKSKNSAGWTFMDFKNVMDGTDKNIVIYGHNRKDGSMFGTLKNILNEDWYNNEDNKNVVFITENENCIYEVFSVYTIEKEDYYITTSFKNDEEYTKFLDKIKSRSIKDFGVEVTSEDQILTLSTCADNNKFRVVLHAKKVGR